MVKEKIILEYTCDLCNRRIRGYVYSPVWAQLDVEEGGNFNRDGDVINVDLCKDCQRRADEMIVGLFTDKAKAETKNTENNENLQNNNENLQNNNENLQKNNDKPAKAETISKKLTPLGRKTKLDDGKIMALHNAGWSNAKIADEMGVSGWTIGEHLKKLQAKRDS